MDIRCVVGVALVAVVLIQGGATAQTPPPAEQVRVTGGLPELNKHIQTNMDLVFRVSRWNGNRLEIYDVLFGPDTVTPSAPLLAEGFFKQEGTKVEFELVSGYLYMAGTEPYGGTDAGRANSDGSIIVIRRGYERADKVVVDRFFLLSTDLNKLGNTATMTVTGNAGSPQTSQVRDQYVDVVRTTTTAEPAHDIGLESVAFLNYVTRRAREAGLLAPDGWPK